MPGCRTSNARSRSCWPTTSIPTCTCRSARAVRSSPRCPTTTSTVRSTSNSTRASSISRRCSRAWSHRVRSVAVDELTGAMRRAAGRLFPAGPPTDAALVVGPAKLVKTVDQIAAVRRACRITEQALVDVQPSVAPGVSQMDLSARFVRRAFELGATTNMIEAIWQVMPTTRSSGAVWTTTGDLALPLLPTEKRVGQGRRAVDRYQHHLRGVLLRLGAYLGGGARTPRPNRTRTSPSGGRFSTPCSP